MEMTVKMTKKEASKLLMDMLKPKLGETEFTVKEIEWPSYSDNVEFSLTTVEASPSDKE